MAEQANPMDNLIWQRGESVIEWREGGKERGQLLISGPVFVMFVLVNYFHSYENLTRTLT
jgi:hypothetical protein